MKNNYKIIFTLLLLVVVGVFVFYPRKIQAPADSNFAPASKSSIVACYVANLAKDVFTLRIDSEQNGKVEGMLYINNFEKDSSNGTINGTYKDGILLADYNFLSEGVMSLGQVVFKRIGSDFVRGYGETDANGQFFKDLKNVTFDTTVVYKISENGCSNPQTFDVVY